MAMVVRFRGQGAVEYLVIFAAVLVVALVVVYLLGGSGNAQAQAALSQARSYWSSNQPFAISDATQSGQVNVTLVVQNTASRELTLTNLRLTLAGTPAATYAYTTDTVFMAGQRRVISVNIGASVPDCTGSAGRSLNPFFVRLDYDDDLITGKVMNSSTLLPVECQ